MKNQLCLTLDPMDKKEKKIYKNITIHDFAAEAKCVAKINNLVVFVENVAPGDVADIEIRKKKKNFLEGRAVKIVKYSPKRVKPFCEHYGVCGGCRWQHIGYDYQLEFKRKNVIDAFRHLGKIDIPEVKHTIGSEKNTYYRNKLEFTFSNKRWITKKELDSRMPVDRDGLGFHKAREFDKIIDIRNCYLQPEPSNTIRNSLRQFAKDNKISFYDIMEHKGFLRNLIIRTANTGEVMVILQVAERDNKLITLLMNYLRENFPIINSLNYVVNNKPNETFLDLGIMTFAGTPYINEKIEDLSFRISPKSFFQTNTDQAYKLFRIVRDLAKAGKDQIVYDLYTGTGTIANLMARDVKKVVGLELVEQAIEDARINSAINNITNVQYFAGDISKILNKEFFETNGKPDLVITDPPRAGMHDRVVEALNRIGVPRIVYISCNPATQARDIGLMKDYYKVVEIQPVDMFPHTHHIENVVLLEKI